MSMHVCVCVCAVSSCGMLRRQEELSGTSGTNQRRRAHGYEGSQLGLKNPDEKKKQEWEKRRSVKKTEGGGGGVQDVGEESEAEEEEEEWKVCSGCPRLLLVCAGAAADVDELVKV